MAEAGRAAAEGPEWTGKPGDRRALRWWGLVSSAAAPLLLIGGWTAAAAIQPGRFDPAVRTISELAGLDARHRWLMTVALIATGVAHVTTAAALRPAAPIGRWLLAAGGLATVGVAAFPLPGRGHGSVPHAVAAGVAFGCLAAWPALSWRRRAARPPWVLRPPVATLATLSLAGCVGAFVAELAAGGPRLGLTERMAAGSQAIWPLVVVLAVRSGRPSSGQPR